MIIGIHGACRRSELLNLRTDDIEDKGSIILIKIQDTKTSKQRIFIISNPSHVELCRKYRSLRPAVTTSPRFFINYAKGRCVNQVIGINKIRNTPKQIAMYLNLVEPDLYTGHCFRRSSATLLADSGADLTSLKRHGGWRSSAVAEGYIEESIEKKIEISKNILGASESEDPVAAERYDQNTISVNQLASSTGIHLNNCTIQNLHIFNK